MIQGAIFDFDGTLFDSMFIWESIGETYLRSLGVEPREDLNAAFKMLSLNQAAEYYRNEYGVTCSVEEITDGVNKMVEHYYFDVVQPKPGVVDFLRRLQDMGVRLCVATATDDYLVQAALSRCGIDFFSEIFTCTSVGAGKDKPVIYRRAMCHLDTVKQKTLVFEDSPHAIQTAKKDGFPVVGVYDQYEQNQGLVKKLANFYFADFLDADQFWKFASDL